MRRVRWTEHGPEPSDDDEQHASGDEGAHQVADAASPPDSEAATPTDVDALRQRLADRGLLRREPSIRIRDVTDAPTPRTPEATFAPVGPSEVADNPADGEGLDAERTGPGSAVRCPTCRTSQDVADDAPGFRCVSCSAIWRWAICANCSEVSLTFARQESWRCSGCGSSSRSWWRTATAPRERQEVQARRRSDLAAERRARAYAIARRRRWKVLVAAVIIVAGAFAAAAVATSRSTTEGRRGPGAAACDLFFQATLTTGADAVAVRTSLDELAAVAAAAPDEIRIPAQRLAAAGRPGDPPFESARAALANACAAFESRN